MRRPEVLSTRWRTREARPPGMKAEVAPGGKVVRHTAPAAERAAGGRGAPGRAR